jgi:cation-dependent mannose-6-phosphate receptor
MHSPSLPTTLLLALAICSGVNAAASDDKPAKALDPCTVSSSAGSFYDLRSLSILPPVDGKKPGKNDKIDDWHARGYDYAKGNTNFTLNICAPVVDPVEGVEGLGPDEAQNVSAYYKEGKKIFSIGYGLFSGS